MSVNLKIGNDVYDMSSPTSENFRKRMIESFGDIAHEKINVIWNHLNGFYFEFYSDNKEEEYEIKIYDNDKILLYETQLKSNMFVRLNRKYFNGINFEIYKKGFLIKKENVSFKNKNVYIAMGSSSLGDTLAWIPYCEEFRKKHKCNVIVSTFMNDLFENQYPELNFISPGQVVKNIHAMFNIGWYYDSTKEPEIPNTIPLQKTITNILGLDFMEVRPKLNFTPKERPINEKYITICTSATAGCKVWFNDYWQTLINYLNEKGYLVSLIQKEPNNSLTNVLDWTGDLPLEDRMNEIYHSEFFIGLGSGVSWLSWAINKKVVMISNFSKDGHEFIDNTTRITNTSVCHGCWNNPDFKFDKGDWYWCPINKNTDKHFECHKSITPQMVIDKIEHLL